MEPACESLVQSQLLRLRAESVILEKGFRKPDDQPLKQCKGQKQWKTTTIDI